MTQLFRRLAAREKQFAAWKNLIPSSAYRAARAALVITDVLRIAVYAAVVLTVVMEPRSSLYALVVIGGSWVALTLIRAWTRDQILANAFATISPAGISPGGMSPAIPFVRRPPPVPVDRDAPDFDDAPPPRRRRAHGGADRDALDFDDAA